MLQAFKQFHFVLESVLIVEIGGDACQSGHDTVFQIHCPTEKLDSFLGMARAGDSVDGFHCQAHLFGNQTGKGRGYIAEFVVAVLPQNGAGFLADLPLFVQNPLYLFIGGFAAGFLLLLQTPRY